MSGMIGILGVTGQVGRALVTQLPDDTGPRLRVGARDVQAAETWLVDAGTAAEAELMPVDVDDQAALTRFVAGCSVVVNCAGPSHRVLDRVGVTAAEAGADYVDPGGDQALRRMLVAAPAARPPFVGVLSAGMTPGLSGLVLRAAVADLDCGASARVWAGGLGQLTPAAAEDYLSVNDPAVGEPAAAWCDGRVVPRMLEPVPDGELPPFPAVVSARPYLSAETVNIARESGLRDVSSYTVFDGARLPAALARARGAVAATALMRAAALDSAGRDPYQLIVVEARGCRDGVPAARRLVVRGRDASSLTGAVAGVVLAEVLGRRISPGVHTAADVLDPAATLRTLAARGVVRVLDVEVEPEGDGTVEEGDL